MSKGKSKGNAGDLAKVSALLERSGIDPDGIARTEKLKLYQAMMRGEDGEPVVVDLASATVVPWPEETDETRYIRRAPATRIVRPLRAVKPRTDGTSTIVILPDPQIGYRRSPDDGRLIPTHDPTAISVGMQILRDLRLRAGDRIVNLGDTLDLGEISRFGSDPEELYTAQVSIDRTALFFADQRAQAPDAAIGFLEGNHDRRLERLVNERAPSILRLARAGTTTPVLSVPYLLRLDEVGVEYIGGFPAGQIELAPGDPATGITPLVAVHGRALTSQRHLERSATSIVHGHTHRVEVAHRTLAGPGGRAVHQTAFSPGCLCRVDGLVPSVHSSSSDGVAIPVVENWQQGLAVVTVQPDGSWTHEQVLIRDGAAVFRGRSYQATADAYAALDGETPDGLPVTAAA